jgi:hypothetical protein
MQDECDSWLHTCNGKGGECMPVLSGKKTKMRPDAATVREMCCVSLFFFANAFVDNRV